jgi:hypothetical protein
MIWRDISAQSADQDSASGRRIAVLNQRSAARGAPITRVGIEAATVPRRVARFSFGWRCAADLGRPDEGRRLHR